MTTRPIVMALHTCLVVSALTGQELPTSGTEMYGYRLSISTDKDSYGPIDAIILKIRLLNTGEDAVTIRKSSVFPTFRIRIMTPEGQEAQLTQFGQKRLSASALSSKRIIELPSHNEYQTEVLLNRHYDMTLSGEYRIIVSDRLHRRHGAKEIVEIDSNTLTINLTDQAADHVGQGSSVGPR